MTKVLSTSYYLGMVVLLTGIILHLAELEYAFWIYLIGLIPVFGVRAFNLIVGKPENFRKNVILVLSAFALTMAGGAMFYERTYWVIFIAISAVLDMYISFRKFS
ncbi:hypothetical protein [Geofilum rubicundum]|uniref:Uncharacterized protein n=1 Tax=Geofilum rubicundum JCM 15548 TaxID=1236989 RepID=A0A0E9LS77_9BACT|nr:hypothetical protein [Geofilum rubicundum]GAO28148.1 hypothetical protein JCM15548_212 [Geofilum rubicundum JCM 15548]